MTEYRRSHFPTKDETVLRVLTLASEASFAASHELQSRLAALSEILSARADAQQSERARTEYNRAVQAARRDVLALRDIQRVLGDKRSLISKLLSDAEELAYALALFNDGCDLNSTHHAFATAIATAHARTVRARNAALHQMTKAVEAPSTLLRAVEPIERTKAANSIFSRAATA